MTPEQLLSHVESRGISMIANGGRLRVNAPLGSMDEELKQAIGAAKGSLLALLEERAARGQRGITPVSRAEPLPVSIFQERMWIMQRLDPELTALNIVSAWPSPAGTSVAAALEAVRALVARHEILRSKFEEVRGVLAMHPLAVDAVKVDVRDVPPGPDSERTAHIRAQMETEAQVLFDLTQGPAVRFVIFRASDTQTAVLMAAHHIVVDAWSLGLLKCELDSLCMGEHAKLAPVTLQFADFASWHRQDQSPSAVSADLDWWTSYLANAPAISLFPADIARRTRPAGASYQVTWRGEWVGALRQSLCKEGVTLYMALLAACASVLRWYTAQEDFVFGSPMGVRERTELETMIGPFVNLMLVRVDASGDPTFSQLLRRTRDSLLEAHARRHVPFELLLERLKPARTLDHSPLFQLAIVQHNAHEGGPASRVDGGALHELTWFLTEHSEGIDCVFEYRSDLFSAETIQRVAAHLEGVLREAARHPERKLSEITVLGAEERRKVLAEFNATHRDFARAPFIREFEKRAAAAGEAVAVSFEGESLSYRALEQRAEALAQRLLAIGVARGMPVGICLERGLALVVALLAVQKAGGAYVPLDPGFPAERLNFMLADSGAKVVVSSDEASGSFEIPDTVAVVNVTQVPTEGGAAPVRAEIRPEDPAYIIYTSGSTGRPKGVVLSQAGLTNFLWSMREEPGLRDADVLAAVTTISFDIAGLELYLPLLVGARIELISRETAGDGEALATTLRDCGATVLQATPATWRLLIEAGWTGGPRFRAFCGGEPLPQALADTLLERVGELWNLYGPTETTIWSTADRVTRDSDAITVGRPIANTRVYIVGSNGELAPPGIAGEILIGGDGVALGYHNRPDLTAERFLPDPFSQQSGARMYRTGDLGRWRADGRIEHLGRLDSQVKIRGFRIELGEIESVLARHPAIRQAVVVAREAGPGDRRLVSYVVFESGEDLTVSEVRRYLRGELPDYMVPSLVVAIESVPLTPNGKVDRAALPDPFRNASAATEYEPPVSPMEMLIAEVWTGVLKLPRVGANDNFFELGGHSLLSLRVAAGVEDRCGWRMDPRTLFFQTLRQIAATGASASGKELRRA